MGQCPRLWFWGFVPHGSLSAQISSAAAVDSEVAGGPGSEVLNGKAMHTTSGFVPGTAVPWHYIPMQAGGCWPLAPERVKAIMWARKKLKQKEHDRYGLRSWCAPHPFPTGIPELVRRLQQRGVQVFLVSGGFHQVIDPIADLLGIPRSHVYANNILYEVFC
jgi:hypothetical protein